jgi:hypothetical protein
MMTVTTVMVRENAHRVDAVTTAVAQGFMSHSSIF